MIFSRDVSLSGIVKLERPLAYEYDSQTESIVLLNGYKYLVDNEEVNLAGTGSSGGSGFSCEGATNSVSFAVAMDQYGFDNIETEEIQNALQFLLDGAVLDIYAEPSAVGLKLDFSVETDVPFQIENGFVVQSVLKYSNISELPKRLEIKSATKHVKFYMWANPTVNQIDGNTRNHVGVCLSANTEPEITCDGATNQVGFFHIVGFWKIEVNGFLYGSDNLSMSELLNEFIPNHEYLKAILDGSFIEDYMLRNKSSEFLRIRFIGSVNFDGGHPDIRDVTNSYDWFLNPTWFAENMQTPTGKVSFCLAPYVPPIEEPEFAGETDFAFYSSSNNYLGRFRTLNFQLEGFRLEVDGPIPWRLVGSFNFYSLNMNGYVSDLIAAYNNGMGTFILSGDSFGVSELELTESNFRSIFQLSVQDGINYFHYRGTRGGVFRAGGDGMQDSFSITPQTPLKPWNN